MTHPKPEAIDLPGDESVAAQWEQLIGYADDGVMKTG